MSALKAFLVVERHHHYERSRENPGARQTYVSDDWSWWPVMTPELAQAIRFAWDERTQGEVLVIQLDPDGRLNCLNQPLRSSWHNSALSWQVGADGVEAFIDGSVLTLGYPRRDKRRIGVLRSGSAQRVLINGRTWHSMTGRRETVRREWDVVMAAFNTVEELLAFDAPTATLRMQDLREHLF